MKHALSIASLLNNSSNLLQQSLRHSHTLQQLEPKLLSQLPSDLANHVRVANLEGGRLHLVTDNSAWATRLRYLLPELQRTVRSSGIAAQPIEHIELSVLPKTVQPKQQRSKPLSLSPHAAQVLEQCAATLEDKALSSALRRLAKNVQY